LAGTSDVDNRSWHIISGCSDLVANQQFAVSLAAKFVSDFVDSVLPEQPVFDGKPCWHGLAAKTAKLAAPMFQMA
jgi:hypothetical protein